MKDVRRAAAIVPVLLGLLALVAAIQALRVRRAIARINDSGGIVVSYANPLPLAHEWYGTLQRGLLSLTPVRSRYEVSFSEEGPGWCGSGMTLMEAPERRRDPGDAGLVPLRGLGRIGWLHLGNTTVSDEGLSALAGLTALEGLDLSGTRVTGPGLVHLRGVGLRALDLTNTPIDDAGLSHLDGLSTLISLGLRNTRVTRAGLAHLRKLPALRALSLEGTRIDDDALQGLAGLPLERLQIWSSPVTDAGIEHLERLPALEWVLLCGSRVTDAAAARSRSAAVNAWPGARPLCRL